MDLTFLKDSMPAWGIEAVYMISALLFVLALKRLGRVRSARQGNRLAMFGMLFATLATLATLGVVEWWVLVGGLAVGTLLGVILATKVEMTGMPELVAFFNGLGGAASALVAMAEVVNYAQSSVPLGASVAGGNGVTYAVAIVASILIGGVTLSGSLIAYGKLSGKIRGNHFGPLGSRVLNAILAIGAFGLAWWAGFGAAEAQPVLVASASLVGLSLVLGIGLTVPIGGADMPVVISLLNSYSGLAACATGFVLENNLLIVAGSLVGASGLILTQIMCKAMNRSLGNVLFADFGEDSGSSGGNDEYTGVRSAGPEEAASILEAARSVLIVPGYGMAVAQAQHKVRDVATWLEKHDIDVKYAIHPVAGRMPGHMNVLLAEADVPYEQLFDLDQINSEFANTDVAIVLGANDVANPEAIDNPKSPIAGMPVLNVWEAGTVMVVKRSLSAGYAGIKNPLFEKDNTLMLFGDAKAIMEGLLTELKDLA